MIAISDPCLIIAKNFCCSTFSRKILHFELRCMYLVNVVTAVTAKICIIPSHFILMKSLISF